jgi:hypothetical protein
MDNQLAEKNRNDFCVAFADLLITWNAAERAATKMLNHLCGNSPQTYILTSELGALGLQNALSSMAFGIVDAPFVDALKHGVDYFDRVREYRNYYVHGIHAVGSVNTEEAFGMIEMLSAKKQFAIDEERVPIERLAEVKMMAGNLFAVWTNIYVHFVTNPAGDKPGWVPLGEFLEAHPLPARLQKPRQHPLSDQS